MQKILSLSLSPAEAADPQSVLFHIAEQCGVSPETVSGYHILKQSLDARGARTRFVLSLKAFINEPCQDRELLRFHFQDVSRSDKKVLVAGAGPAGLFAALRLIELGIKPIVIERGSDVRRRRRDLAALNKFGELNPESNYCFGEGGAGTYSDGKLYTRSKKRGDVDRILNAFVHFGAEKKILYEAHPHIGTNKLPGIISAMRTCINEQGGEFHLNKKITGLVVRQGRIQAVETADGDLLTGDALILATGHSARDVFHLLYRSGIRIESKPFALGVRVEHPQQLINDIQYRRSAEPRWLPPASYAVSQQIDGRGVFSFCMCPGGIIAPASTGPQELVVNGWSPSKRNNPYANSGIVTEVPVEEVTGHFKKSGLHPAFPAGHPLQLMAFQQAVEQACYQAGGGQFVAPAQRLTDFFRGQASGSLPPCSYYPGTSSQNLGEVLPGFIYERLAGGFRAFGKKMKGYLSEEAIVVATESRTSSPVRIPREAHTLAHPQIGNLYPCGEGAGYAGGIVSAAMDGERSALHCAEQLRGIGSHDKG